MFEFISRLIFRGVISRNSLDIAVVGFFLSNISDERQMIFVVVSFILLAFLKLSCIYHPPFEWMTWRIPLRKHNRKLYGKTIKLNKLSEKKTKSPTPKKQKQK